MSFSAQYGVPFPMRNFPPDPPANAYRAFRKSGDFHILKISRQLFLWPIECNHLDHVPAIFDNATNCSERRERIAEIIVSRGMASITKVIKRRSLTVVTSRNPVRRRRLPATIHLPSMIKYMNTRVWWAGHD